MRFHATVIDKLLYLFQTYGGYANEDKLRKHISELDLTPYERKSGTQEIVIVLTEEYMKQLGQRGR